MHAERWDHLPKITYNRTINCAERLWLIICHYLTHEITSGIQYHCGGFIPSTRRFCYLSFYGSHRR